MPSDQQPDKLRLVAVPDDRLDADEREDGPREKLYARREAQRMAGTPDEDLRIHRIGSADPMAELSDTDEDADIELDDDDDEAVARDGTRSRLLPVATAVFALLGFAGIIWYAYQWSVGDIAPEELPVIRAEATPSKIRPESPGGLEVPYQETLALNDIRPDPEKPQVERLLPPPETPLPPPRIAVPETPVEAAPEPTPSAEAAAEPAPAAPETTAAIPAPAAPPAPTTAAPSDGFLLQLASLKSRERAPGEWTRLQKSFPNLLGDRQLVVLSVDLADRGTFYRVQAGYFPDRASAEAVCKQLKAKSQDCLVTKR